MGTAVVAPVLPGVSIVNDTLGLGRARRLSRRLEAYESFLPAEVACSTVMAAMELVAAGAGHVITKLDRGGGKTQYLNTQLNLVVRTNQSFGMRDIKLPGGTVAMPHQLHPPCLLYSLHLPYLHLPTPTTPHQLHLRIPTYTHVGVSLFGEALDPADGSVTYTVECELTEPECVQVHTRN